MRALVIYDLSGHVWNVVYGADDAPEGLLYLWVDIPSGTNIVSVDVSDMSNPQPVFSYIEKNTDIKILQDKLVEIERKLTEVDSTVSETIEKVTATAEELTYTQIALTEVYESVADVSLSIV